jgi:hypothetical protein
MKNNRWEGLDRICRQIACLEGLDNTFRKNADLLTQRRHQGCLIFES